MKYLILGLCVLNLTIVHASEVDSTDCLDSSLIKYSKIAFEGVKKLDDGSFWIKGVHFVDGENLVRLKANDLNKKRICQTLGFMTAIGSRIEFDSSSKVVSINKDLKITKQNKPKTKFIQNITCK
jgi:hypothetical protein